MKQTVSLKTMSQFLIGKSRRATKASIIQINQFFDHWSTSEPANRSTSLYLLETGNQIPSSAFPHNKMMESINMMCCNNLFYSIPIFINILLLNKVLIIMFIIKNDEKAAKIENWLEKTHQF
jgi:hypothetical protein